MKKVVVIGGGPAGMFAAGMAAKNGCSVILAEKNEKLGKKLFITGKGRCNVTNDTDPEGLIAHTVSNPYFLYSAFYSFSAQDTMAFFEESMVENPFEGRIYRIFLEALGKRLESEGEDALAKEVEHRLYELGGPIEGEP